LCAVKKSSRRICFDDRALRIWRNLAGRLARPLLKRKAAMNTRINKLQDATVAQTTGSLANNFDFAVGFSRQPLPTGNRFAIVTNASGPGIRATDATARRGLDLTTLRPETIESVKAKLPPTANVIPPGTRAGTFSTSERARVGLDNKITNGVKQKLPGAGLLGVGSFSSD